MKSLKTNFALLTVVIAAFTAISPHLQSISGQSNSQEPRRGESRVKPTVLMTHTSPRETSVAPFALAAAENATLRTELAWTFGGKQQRGWYLYEFLLNETLKTNPSAAIDFASSLATWQGERGLLPTGILDENTLMAIVALWQERRIKNRTPALPDQLLTAPATDFYHFERPAELRQVERETYAAYRRLIAAAIADPNLNLKTVAGELAPEEKFLKIISAFRTREYQEELRRKSPNSGRAGLAINSPHFTGRALDLYVGGEPVETRDSNRAVQVNTPVYQWLVRNAERFGFRPYFYEPWHWEYVR